ncbi:hypothetical protein GALMADRAFT_133901 [Galerina marginata CBS 339.88]|uniref:SET domain-containing protein n=1 Tax=Galerina marginata (strain CBS 339.88) TaxID=685588 RepID=A0A067TN51_GALM3|nr:hypothetical protein GALMADRAFT_133901 [Galerina marginata CBS 339.88]
MTLQINPMGTTTFNVAELAKRKGNAAFVAKDYVTAKSLYTYAMAIDQLNHVYPLNRSMANLQLARWDEAEVDATTALHLAPDTLKALFRRGRARRGLGNWAQARNDIQMFIDHGGDLSDGAQELKAIADAESLLPPETFSTSANLNDTLANLECAGGPSSFVVHASAIVQSGEGAFASREFQRGELILSEKPLFSVQNVVPERQKLAFIQEKVRNLSPTHLDRFLSLHNSHTNCSCYPNLALGIYGTNAFALSDESGICLKASKFNHSCSPNARHSFNAITGECRIYALVTIPVGEEIFITYISGRKQYGETRLSRQNLLSVRHFTCACSVCSLPEAESKLSDARRVMLNELWESIPSFLPTQGAQRLRVIVKGIHLLKEEGYMADADDFSNDAGAVCAYHSDWVSTKYWTHFTYQTRVAEFGENSPRAREVRDAYLNPHSIPMAGQGPPKKFTTIRV